MQVLNLSGKYGTGRVALVDDADYALLSKRRWCLTRKGYVASRGELLHRVVMSTPVGLHTDHISGNRLDNRRSNLRIVTQADNNKNTSKKPNNTSGYKGVRWFKRDQKWHARIMANYREYHLGYFDSKIEAAKAYNAAAIKYFGEFARLNEV